MNPPSRAAAPKIARRSLAPLPTGVFAGFMVAIAAVLVTTYLAYASLTDRSATAERTTQAYEVLGRMQNVRALVTDAETAERGFLLTGNEVYLEPYNQARPAVLQQIVGLQNLLAGHADQQRRLDALTEAVKQKMEDIDRIVALHRAGDTEAALALVRIERGRIAMARIRTLVAEMEREGALDLASRHREWQDAARTSFLVTFGGSLLLLVLIGFAAWSAVRNHRERERQVWLRSGHNALSDECRGPRIDLRRQGAAFLVAPGARVGALYVKENRAFRRGPHTRAMRIRSGARHVEGGGLLGRRRRTTRPARARGAHATSS